MEKVATIVHSLKLDIISSSWLSIHKDAIDWLLMNKVSDVPFEENTRLEFENVII